MNGSCELVGKPDKTQGRGVWDSCEGLESHAEVVAFALSLVTEHYRNLNKL